VGWGRKRRRRVGEGNKESSGERQEVNDKESEEGKREGGGEAREYVEKE